MITKIRIVLFVLTFIFGLLASYCGSDDDKKKAVNSSLAQSFEFASQEENRGEFDSWDQIRAVNGIHTSFRQKVRNKADKSEIYFYNYFEGNTNSYLSVSVHTLKPGNSLEYEIEDDDLDGIADEDSGIRVNFPATDTEASENRRIVPSAQHRPELQEVYNRAIALYQDKQANMLAFFTFSLIISRLLNYFMNIKPLGNRVLVKQLSVEEVTASGIVLADQTTIKRNRIKAK